MKTVYIILLNMLIVTISYAKVTELTLAPYFLYQFANHIQKPNKKNSYNIHIIGKDPQIKKGINKVLKNKKINGKDIFLTQASGERVPNNTDMIYMAPDSGVPFSKISSYVVGKSILLISFDEQDKRSVMINIYVTDEEKLSFEINRANILNEGFTISDKVVLMGGTELDVAELFKGAKESLQENELLLKKNRIALKESNEKLKKSQRELVLLNKRSKKYLEDINKAKIRIEQINNDMNREKEAYKEQIIKNKTLEEMVLENQKINKKVKDDLDNMLEVIKEKNKFIKKREEDLETLNQEISAKEKSLEELVKVAESQGEKISIQESTINQQKKILFVVVVALVGFTILIVTIVIIMKRLKATLLTLEETQAELLENEKMASLGKLVSGLAHEMNTPIGVSMTGVSVLKNKTPMIQEKLTAQTLKQSELEKYLDEINDISKSAELSLKKAAQLVQSFKKVSVDQQVDDIREFNLKEYIDVILISFNNQLNRDKIKVSVDIDDSLVINSFAGAYYQVITNLINNSLIHAFSDAEEGNILISASIEDDTVELIYKDDGKGVNENDLKEIFEPFFTTKRADGGTGLGLHIIYNLITQKLHGKINAISKEGQGLSIYIKLPLDIGSA